MALRFEREDIEDAIEKLAEHYPKCFFVDSHLRQPLKKNIAADLEKDGAPLSPELISAAINFYQNHFDYMRAIEAGAKRLDLNGKSAGTVTELEQRDAKKKYTERKQELHERNLSYSVETTKTLHKAGRVTDDALRKIETPREPIMAKAKDTAPVAAPAPADPFAQLQTIIQGLREVVAGVPPPMRGAYLAFLNAEVQRLMSESVTK